MATQRKSSAAGSPSRAQAASRPAKREDRRRKRSGEARPAKVAPAKAAEAAAVKPAAKPATAQGRRRKPAPKPRAKAGAVKPAPKPMAKPSASPRRRRRDRGEGRPRSRLARQVGKRPRSRVAAARRFVRSACCRPSRRRALPQPATPAAAPAARRTREAARTSTDRQGVQRVTEKDFKEFEQRLLEERAQDPQGDGAPREHGAQGEPARQRRRPVGLLVPHGRRRHRRDGAREGVPVRLGRGPHAARDQRGAAPDLPRRVRHLRDRAASRSRARGSRRCRTRGCACRARRRRSGPPRGSCSETFAARCCSRSRARCWRSTSGPSAGPRATLADRAAGRRCSASSCASPTRATRAWRSGSARGCRSPSTCSRSPRSLVDPLPVRCASACRARRARWRWR